MTLQLLIHAVEKVLHVACEGQLELPKQPPFDPKASEVAAIVTLEIGVGSPNLARIFDTWYIKKWRADVLAWDGGPAILAPMYCVEINWERGLQITRPWSEPLRRTSVNGQSALYRPTPRHQVIKGTTNRYVLVAVSWQQVGVPEQFKKRSGLVEVYN